MERNTYPHLEVQMVRESLEFSAALMLAVKGSWPSLDLSSISLATDGVLKKKKIDMLTYTSIFWQNEFLKWWTPFVFSQYLGRLATPSFQLHKNPSTVNTQIQLLNSVCLWNFWRVHKYHTTRWPIIKLNQFCKIPEIPFSFITTHFDFYTSWCTNACILPNVKFEKIKTEKRRKIFLRAQNTSN